MSLLAGHNFVLQADRERLLDLMQTYVRVGGTPLSAPFRLRVPRQGGILGPRTDAVDIIIKSVRLMLNPGTNQAVLMLGVEAGVVRIDAEETPFTSGELHVGLEFESGTLLAVKPKSLSLHGVGSTVTDFVNRANLEVNKLLDTERDQRVELFPDIDDQAKLMLIFSKPRVIDSVTVGLFLGDGDPTQVDRAIATGRSISFALAADFVRTNILCRALLSPSERDPAWTAGGPTDLERGRLPAPCGTGHLSRGRDGVDVRITTLNFAFRDGFIEVSGNFDAEDTCWKIRGGTFEQKLFLDFDKATVAILPRLEPSEPIVHYDADILFICRALGFLAGVLVPYIGSVALGIVAVVALEIVKALVDPDIPAQQQQLSPVQGIEGITWESLAIASEGLHLQGSIATEQFSDAHQPSRTWLAGKNLPANVQEGPGGEALYQAPTCEPRVFKYRDFTQQDVKELRLKPEWLVNPVQIEWFVDDMEIPNDAGSPLRFTTTVRTALPPPDGDEVSGHAVELGYDFGLPLGVIGVAPWSVKLTPRPADLRYEVRVEARVTDGAGRTFWSAANPEFIGAWAEFGSDYDEYRSECFKKVRDIVDKKAKVKRRLKPGEPQEEIEWAANYIREYMEARSPETGTVIDAATKLHGVRAINHALAQKRQV